MMTLTPEELENSAYNEAAEYAARGDMKGAAEHVVDRPPRYLDAEDARVRAIAHNILDHALPTRPGDFIKPNEIDRWYP